MWSGRYCSAVHGTARDSRLRHGFADQTFTEDGEVEEGMILLQLKATDGLKSRSPFVSWPIERADLVSWLRQPMPVILVVYDAQKDMAFWLYVQSYFHQRRGFNLFAAGKTITVRLPRENIVHPQAIRRFAQFRDSALQQIEVIHEEN